MKETLFSKPVMPYGWPNTTYLPQQILNNNSKYSELSVIRELVERHTKIDISTKNRKREVIYARYLYYTLCRENTLATYRNIADSLGGFNHATVLHGVNCFKDTIIRFDKRYKEIYNSINVPVYKRGIERTLKEKSPTEYYKKKFINLMMDHRRVLKSFRNTVDELNKSKKLNKENEDIIHNLRSENSRLAMVPESENI